MCDQNCLCNQACLCMGPTVSAPTTQLRPSRPHQLTQQAGQTHRAKLGTPARRRLKRLRVTVGAGPGPFLRVSNTVTLTRCPIHTLTLPHCCCTDKE